eukprot:CAMPEP_0170270424 /NCGR_PEP_ID=MMETSP0116_2-20130129/35157_1 /TAXON_ID=400756 /ORGANISM="Durinskia baltica, Strain CSIRO CS-38" /LENGTH=465 /DNA_ID=CAMNT_0010521617 /DNA_START=1 /DNA_END=1395 /DNA_ORIENTATION=-
MGWPQCCQVCPSNDKTRLHADDDSRATALPRVASKRRTSLGNKDMVRKNIGLLATRGGTKDATWNLSRSVGENAEGTGAGDGSSTRADAASDKPTASHSSKCSGQVAEEEDELMPFRKQKARAEGGLARRRSIDCMEGYLVDGTRADGMQPSISLEAGADKVNAHSAPPPAAAAAAEGSAADSAPLQAGLADFRRMNTAKELFADPGQTFIIFDWDDTLFPTTYVRDDMRLDWRTPLRLQPLAQREKVEITRLLAKCAENACASLRTASGLGKVVLVTLARPHWVRDSCTNFFPKVGALIQELQIPVIYAQEGQQIEYDKTKMTSNEDVERFWSHVKSKAIADELKRFYSQYEGQSWKNVISIGDSDFERLGTQQAAIDYLKEAGIATHGGLLRQKTTVVAGHTYKVRTKTFKMLDQPTVEELTVELAMLQQWLPGLVKLDGSCDINLSDLEDPKSLQRIERTLR